ncbi:MAG: protein O-mannosyl-transferase family [Gemmatimonadales bacterium]
MVVLIGYVITLAPTVTFWDAGELIAAARTLGIPHPPGSPFFVLLANVWGRVFPIGGYAWRINMLSAVCTAAAGGCWFLVVHDTLMRMHADVDPRARRALALTGGWAAALLASFTYSIWQNATGAEVYAPALLGIALIIWLSVRWRQRRNHFAGARILLLALYLGALSLGTHLLGLLGGAALIVGIVAESTANPLAALPDRRAEWSRIAVIAAAWAALVAIGLASGPLIVAAIVALVAAAFAAGRTRQASFAIVAVAILAAGVSTELFLLLRAAQHPWLNEANPSTWHALVDVIRRAQYPPRTPFDDPTLLHGPGNPGRTVVLLAYQVANYAQYFDWQWAASIGSLDRASVVRLAVTLAMATIAVRGAFAQRAGDRTGFRILMALFLVTGPLLVLYLNFRPGPSIGWNRWPNLTQHEVRDRDYFFVASFAIAACWVAIGLIDLMRGMIPRLAARRKGLAMAFAAVALIPLALSFRAATRRQTPEATFAVDFGRALLASVPPHGILFTWGDNDTFPLWYLQAVERTRTDVSVVCLALAQTPWYLKELRDVHRLDDATVDALHPFVATRDLVIPLPGGRAARIAAGTEVDPRDSAVFATVRANAGRRPIAWALSASDALYGLGPSLMQQGLVLVLPARNAISGVLATGRAAGPDSTPLDVTTTRRLADSNWHFGRLEAAGDARLDGNIQAVADLVAAPLRQLGLAAVDRGDTAEARRELRRAVRLAGDSAAAAALATLDAHRSAARP